MARNKIKTAGETQEGGKARESLFAAIAALQDPNECEAFLNDLCTPQELDALAGRWQVARLLDREVPYRAIYEQTGVSTATVTRVARVLRDGDSGYQILLERLEGKRGTT